MKVRTGGIRAPVDAGTCDEQSSTDAMTEPALDPESETGGGYPEKKSAIALVSSENAQRSVTLPSRTR